MPRLFSGLRFCGLGALDSQFQLLDLLRQAVIVFNENLPLFFLDNPHLSTARVSRLPAE